MRIAGIVRDSIVDGIGIRDVIFVQGCPHHCRGCHNPESWNVNGGEEYSIESIVNLAKNSPYDITFSGGDPLYQVDELKAVIGQIYQNKGIWVYTGYTWEEIMESDTLKSVLPYIDVLVDGRFEEDKRNPELVFKGSENQRIIDVQKSLKENKIVLWEDI